MSGRALGISLALLCAAGAQARPAAAQVVIDPVEELDFQRPESWAQKYFTSVTMLTGFGSPRPASPWSVELGFEGGWVPSLSESQRTVGFDGTKPEDLNKTDVFGRVQVTLGFPGKVSATLAYTPPVTVGGVNPNVLGLAVGRPVLESPRARLGLRLHGQTGTIEGDFTCTEEQAAAGNDPVENPFACEAPSEDVFVPRYVGLELAASFPVREGRIEPWVSGSANWLHTEFRVRSLYSGIDDRTTLRTEGWTAYLTAGSDFALSARVRLAAEVFYSRLAVERPPAREERYDDLFHARLLLRWTVRE